MMEKYININKNKHSIRCKIYCSDGEKFSHISNVVICAHGFAGSKENSMGRKVSAAVLKRADHTILLAFDWPCHGSDAMQRIRLADCDLYLTEVLEFIREKYAPERIFYSGVSFGGYLGLKYISEHGNPFCRMALRCPAVPMYTVLTGTILKDQDLAELNKGREVLTGFEKLVKIRKEFVSELKENDLFQRDFTGFSHCIRIVHGTEDEIVPYCAVQDFAQRNGIPLVTVPGANHTFSSTAKMEEAVSEVSRFILDAIQ